MFRPERPIKSCVTANVGRIKKTQAVKSLRVNLRLCVSEHQSWASYFETVIRLLVTERCYSLTGEHRYVSNAFEQETYFMSIHEKTRT